MKFINGDSGKEMKVREIEESIFQLTWWENPEEFLIIKGTMNIIEEKR